MLFWIGLHKGQVRSWLEKTPESPREAAQILSYGKLGSRKDQGLVCLKQDGNFAQTDLVGPWQLWQRKSLKPERKHENLNAHITGKNSGVDCNFLIPGLQSQVQAQIQRKRTSPYRCVASLVWSMCIYMPDKNLKRILQSYVTET